MLEPIGCHCRIATSGREGLEIIREGDLDLVLTDLMMGDIGGIEIVADETYGAADTDMTPQLTKIRSSGAQAVLNAGFGQGPAIVTRNYRQVGLALPLYQSHGVASKEYVKLSGAAAEGVVRRPG